MVGREDRLLARQYHIRPFQNLLHQLIFVIGINIIKRDQMDNICMIIFQITRHLTLKALFCQKIHLQIHDTYPGSHVHPASFSSPNPCYRYDSLASVPRSTSTSAPLVRSALSTTDADGKYFLSSCPHFFFLA